MVRETGQAAAPTVATEPPRGVWLEAGFVFLFVITIYVVSPVVTSGDSHFVIPTALSLLRHGDANIDEYQQRFPEARWAVMAEKGHFWSLYPIGVPLLTLPFVWLIDEVKRFRGTDFEAAAIQSSPLFEELLIASFFTALAVTFSFVIARRQLSLPRALWLALLCAFGTPAWSTASRGLWQHGPAIMLLAASILLYERLDRWKVPGAVLLGILSGYSFSVRPASLMIILGFGVLLLMTSPARLRPYLVGVALGVAPLFWFHLSAFGTWMSYYYRLLLTSVRFGVPPPGPAFAVLVSPSRGLFVYSPFLLFVFVRFLPSQLRRSRPTPLEILLFCLAVAWWVGVAGFPNWWGGGSYGPRLLSECALCATILMIPVFGNLSLSGRRQKLLTTGLVVASVLSVAVHYRGATNTAVFEWNGRPTRVDTHPERNWDWRDPQFLRGLRRPTAAP